MRFAVEDWDLFEHVLNFTYKQHIRSESIYHPVLMSEPPVRSSVACVRACLRACAPRAAT